MVVLPVIGRASHGHGRSRSGSPRALAARGAGPAAPPGCRSGGIELRSCSGRGARLARRPPWAAV